MIKRFFFLLCAVIFVVIMMAFPVFATEVQNGSSIKIVKQPSNFFFDKESSDLPFFEVFVEGDVASYQWYYLYGNSWRLSSIASASTSRIEFSSVERDTVYRCVITGTDGTVLYSDECTVFVTKRPLLEFSSFSIQYVISWISMLLTSLCSPDGSLYPLFSVLVIGIAVAAVLLVIKIFKSFSWGL